MEIFHRERGFATIHNERGVIPKTLSIIDEADSIPSSAQQKGQQPPKTPFHRQSSLALVKKTREQLRSRERAIKSRDNASRGFSHSGFEGLRPLPEKPEDPSPHIDPDEFPLSPPEKDELQSSRSSSSPTTGRYSNDLGESNTWSVGTGETGNITGRSSVYSWGNSDDFDRRATDTVQRLFDEIDDSLFEKMPSSTRSEDSQLEYKDWSTTFPHLRVLGDQLVQSSEDGTHTVYRTHEANSSEEDEIIEEDFDLDFVYGPEEAHNLAVSGYRVEAMKAPRRQHSTEDTQSIVSESLAHLQEEVFAEHGEMEEYIAYDDDTGGESRDRYTDESALLRHRDRKYKHGAIPPVTPNASMRDTIISRCFDELWRELVIVLKELLRLYIDKVKETKGYPRDPAYFPDNRHMVESSMDIPIHEDGIPPIVGQMQSKRTSLDEATELTGLNKLMTIRSVALQHRSSSVATNITHEEGEREPPPTALSKDQFISGPGRPYSINQSNSHSNQPNNQLTIRNVQSISNHSNMSNQSSLNQLILANSRQIDASLYDRLISAKTPKRAIRLQPLQHDRVKTPGMMSDSENFGEVRGTRLQTAVDRLTPQLSAIRNGMLPPLDRVETADNLKERRNSPKQRANNRSASAATRDVDSPVLRERTLSYLPDSRPNTTHALNAELLLGLSANTRRPSVGSRPHGVSSGYLHHGSGNKSVSFGEDIKPEEFDDFVLWGRGPPIISSHQKTRKGKVSTNR